jgi:hypothetical protein
VIPLSNTTDGGESGEELTGIILDIKIWNTNAPAALVGCEMKAAVDGKVFQGQFLKIPDGLSLSGRNGVHLPNPSNSLFDKTAGEKILDNPIDGSLYFIFQISKSLFQKHDTVITITLEDSNGGMHTFTKALGDWINEDGTAKIG